MGAPGSYQRRKIGFKGTQAQGEILQHRLCIPDDDNLTVAFLIDSEDEKHALAAQNAAPQ